MPREQSRADYGRRARQARARPTETGHQAESKLDLLLDRQAQRAGAHQSQSVADQPANPVDALRRLFETDLIPVVDELRAKYEPRGVQLALEAGGFLQGGRQIALVIEYGGSGIRLEGVVMPNAIAFHQMRYGEDIPGGVTGSGPMLRARSLTADSFRHFVCDQMGSLVQSVLRRQ